MKKLMFSALAAVIACAAAAATALYPGVVASPAKVTMVDAVSTNATATVQLKRVTVFRYSTPSYGTVVSTNGWTGTTPVIATNLVRSVVVTEKAVTNAVVTGSCSGGVLSTNVSFAVFPGDELIQLGTAESVRMVAE